MKTMTKIQFSIIILVVIFAVVISNAINAMFNAFANTSNRYEQLVNNKSQDNLTVSQDIIKDAAKPTVKDMQEYFKPPTFLTWFTNDTFYLKDLEIGKIKYRFLSSDECIPEIKTSVVSIANGNTIIAFDPKKHDEGYLEFTYRNLRYQICCSKKRCIKIYGRQLDRTTARIHFCNMHSNIKFWFRKMLNRTIYVSKWTIDNDGNEWLKVYRDDEDKIIVEFNHVSGKE